MLAQAVMDWQVVSYSNMIPRQLNGRRPERPMKANASGARNVTLCCNTPSARRRILVLVFDRELPPPQSRCPLPSHAVGLVDT